MVYFFAEPKEIYYVVCSYYDDNTTYRESCQGAILMSEALAQQIKKYRNKLNWSQQKLAGESGLSIGQIQSMEIGRIAEPGKSVLIKLADAFGISLDELVGRKHKKKQ